MYKLSEIVSKQVIALRGAQLLGTVADIRFNPSLKKADSLLLIDGEENDETLLRLPVRSIATMKEDSVVVKTLSAPLKSDFGATNNPVNLPCCNQDGKILGRLSDIEFDDAFAVTAFLVGDERHNADTLLSFSDCLVIFNDSGIPIKLPKPKPPRPKESDKKIMASITATPPIQASAETTAATEEPRDPERVQVTTPTTAPLPSPEFGTPDFSFLLGKRVMQPLCSSCGRLIAPRDAIITEEIIADAGRENKLVQLTLRAL